MPNIDDYLNDNPEQQAGAYYFLRDTQDAVIETLEEVLAELVDVQNFAQLRKAIATKRDGIAWLLDMRKRAREILKEDEHAAG